jgi:hypothetical protein
MFLFRLSPKVAMNPSNDKIYSILTEIPHSEADDCYPLCPNWSIFARPTLFYSGQAWCPFLLVLSARKTRFFEVHDPPQAVWIIGD